MIKTIQLTPGILAALRRGEIPMFRMVWSPSPAWPKLDIWLEILSPESVRVSEHTRDEFRRERPDLCCFLDRLDSELASANIELGAPSADEIAPTIHNRRCRVSFPDDA